VSEQVKHTRSATEERPIRVAVITVSDRAYQGIYKDESGPKVAAAFPKDIYEVVITKIVPDEVKAIANEIINCVDNEHVDVVVTTGWCAAARCVMLRQMQRHQCCIARSSGFRKSFVWQIVIRIRT
jgi:folate-dependent phosphoribosylglycinamide formyltransferase PurN